MIVLRDYQTKLVSDIRAAWASGEQYVCAVLPTGGGKTVCYASLISQDAVPSIVLAHRNELVSQTSRALILNGVSHHVVGASATVAWCRKQSVALTGRNLINPRAHTLVASVDTLNRRDPGSLPILNHVQLAVCDEAHHLQRDNKWGTAAKLFPRARWAGFTATPERGDGRGLNAPDGFFTALVEGPKMRELIDQGALTDFIVYAPRTNIDLTHVSLTAKGDYSPQPLARAVHDSSIVGDVVKSYLRFAPGKTGITFCVNVEEATKTKEAYCAAGVPAIVITGETPPELRANLMERFARGEYKQLCAVDIVSEGTDIPAVEVVSFARPSQSYVLVAQQLGRALRPLPGKIRAIVIDHVGNMSRFARVAQWPDRPPTIEIDREVWSLGRKEKRERSNATTIATRVCSACLGEYPRLLGRVCPYCNTSMPLAERSSPEYVDGVLAELSPEALAKLQGEILRIDSAPYIPHGLPIAAQRGIVNRYQERQEAQRMLREAMALWGGVRTGLGIDIDQAQREFYHTFGVDVGTAQTLGRPQAEELLKRIKGGS